MRFINFTVNPSLRNYIEKLWAFESKGRAQEQDIKLIAPNGRIKIAIPYKNAILAEAAGISHLTKEHSITLVGYFDVPASMNFVHEHTSGTICAELSPQGAYRFFKFGLYEIQNKHITLREILGKSVAQLEEQMANERLVDKKAELFQEFLFQQFCQQEYDPIFEYCIRKIVDSEGRTKIGELERESGYSSRWLNMKFVEKLGTSPKNFSSLVRFRKHYQIVCNGTLKSNGAQEFYDDYYDQSHFIKEFKRFTGISPVTIQKKINEFGKVFYNV